MLITSTHVYLNSYIKSREIPQWILKIMGGESWIWNLDKFCSWDFSKNTLLKQGVQKSWAAAWSRNIPHYLWSLWCLAEVSASSSNIIPPSRFGCNLGRDCSSASLKLEAICGVYLYQEDTPFLTDYHTFSGLNKRSASSGNSLLFWDNIGQRNIDVIELSAMLFLYSLLLTVQAALHFLSFSVGIFTSTTLTKWIMNRINIIFHW